MHKKHFFAQASYLADVPAQINFSLGIGSFRYLGGSSHTLFYDNLFAKSARRLYFRYTGVDVSRHERSYTVGSVSKGWHARAE